jgi:starch synthase
VAFRSRWDNQKGVVLLTDCVSEIMKRARVLVCVCGTPGQDESLRSAWESLKNLAAARPDRLQINPTGIATVEETASHYGVADLFLMPSKYEPCGLTQMECQRYGTVPIVRHTGGLADTVFESTDSRTASPNGFVFQDMDTRQLLDAVDRALAAFHEPSAWSKIVENALRQANGWPTRVPEYEEVFSKAPNIDLQPTAAGGS